MNKGFKSNGRKLGISLIIASVLLIIMVSYFLVNSEEIHAVETTNQPEAIVEVEEVVEIEPETTATEEEIVLLSLVTMAEAEGECAEGQRLVIDTILNRVDHPRFPNTIHKVVYQKNQFTSMWNGRVKRCYVRDDIRQLVMEELQSRTNHDVIFFRTGRYSSYGSPIAKVGNHYFSKY